MPELPEVEAVRRSLEPLVLGRRVVDVKQAWHRTTAPQSEKTFKQRLVGQTFVSTSRVGKYLFVKTRQGDTLMIHLRMTGQVLGVKAGTELGPHERLRLILDDDSMLSYVDQRKFGRVNIFTAAEFGQLPSVLALGPDALDLQLNEKWLRNRLETRKIPIKAALLDQHVLAGLGNIYVDEALLRSGIHPLSQANAIPLKNLKVLLKQIQAVLNESIRYQGTTFRDYRNARGEQGGFFAQLYAYGQTGKLCRRCKKSKIIKLRVAQRGTHVCERCQKIYAGRNF